MFHFQTEKSNSKTNPDKLLNKKKENKNEKFIKKFNMDRIYTNDKNEKDDEKITTQIYIKTSSNLIKGQNNVVQATNNSIQNRISSPKSTHGGASSDEFHEYQGLSYKTSKITPVKSVDLYDQSESTNDKITTNKKPIEKDFKIKFKTEICKFYQVNRVCKYGDNCAFAHGFEDIREKTFLTNNYKTKKCKQFFESGYCTYGLRCQFLHKDTSQNSANLSPRFSYKKTINSLIHSPTTSCENYLSEEALKNNRPRLKTFENIAKDIDNENKNKLYEDILNIKTEFISQYNSNPNEDEDSSAIRVRFMSA